MHTVHSATWLRWVLALVTASVLCGACSSSSGSSSTASSTASSAGSVATAPKGTPPEVERAANDWPLPSHDYSNTRATKSSSINAGNVDKLKVAWRSQPAGMGALTTSPLVLGDTVYYEDSNGSVYALNRTSGDVRWKSKGTGFNIGPFGVAVGGGRVFAVRGTDGVIALDASNGNKIWERTISPNTTTGVDIQPQLYNGKVLVSTVPISTGGIYIGGDHGVISALDASTGRVKWSFDTVDSADVWGNPNINSGGGAWYPIAVDPARGVAYAGIANPAPFPGTAQFPNGSSRPGRNLYTDSVVALDLKSGKLRWFQQVTQHDIFDRDQVHAMVARLSDGKDVVVSSGKSGVVIGVDPNSGAVLWRTPIGRHSNDDLTALPGPTVVSPGTYGGVLTPPSTADGIAYFPVVNAPVSLEPNKTAYFGADVSKGNGAVVAVDARTGAVSWTRTLPGNPLGGTTVVNNLVFTALVDGTVLALDRTDGDIVWRHQAGGGINGWMSVAGNMIIVPVSSGKPPAMLALSVPER